MEIKKTALKTNTIHVGFNVKAPNNIINMEHLDQTKIQYAFYRFFQQNPEVLEYIFRNLDNISQEQSSIQVPKITKQEREAILASIEEAPEPDDVDSEKWIRDIQNSRMNVQNRPDFFNEE